MTWSLQLQAGILSSIRRRPDQRESERVSQRLRRKLRPMEVDAKGGGELGRRRQTRKQETSTNRSRQMPLVLQCGKHCVNLCYVAERIPRNRFAKQNCSPVTAALECEHKNERSEHSKIRTKFTWWAGHDCTSNSNMDKYDSGGLCVLVFPNSNSLQPSALASPTPLLHRSALTRLRSQHAAVLEQNLRTCA